jgi:hypothetical protein
MLGGGKQPWQELSLGERIVHAAWMAVREHQQAQEHPEDQASELRRLVFSRRLDSLQHPNEREAA